MTTRPKRLRTAAMCVALTTAWAVSGCGGGGTGAATIGGTVTGLGSGLSLTLQNNASDNFTITGNGATSFTFNFAATPDSGATYNASVLTQPLGQTCIVTNASGTVDGSADAVTSILVTCATTSSVVGTVSGLQSGVAVTLTSNGVALLLGNGAFSFPGLLTPGSTYAVTVTQQPVGQTCSVTGATGTVVANKSAAVSVTCV